MLPPFVEENSGTKTTINVSSEDKITYRWAVGDILGVYPTNGNQISFELTEGSISSDGSKANFDGGDWALKADRTYFSYFPFNREAYSSFTHANRVPVNYLGQQQTTFGSTDNAGHYDFLAAGGQTASSSGALFFNFKRLGALLGLRFTLPETGSYQSLTLSTDSDVIPVSGYVDLTSDVIEFHPETYTSSIAINLNNTSGTEGEVEFVYMMLPPMTLNTLGKTLSVRLSYNNGTYSDYVVCKTGMTEADMINFNAGTVYKRDAVPVEDPNGLNTEDFGHSEGNW